MAQPVNTKFWNIVSLNVWQHVLHDGMGALSGQGPCPQKFSKLAGQENKSWRHAWWRQACSRAAEQTKLFHARQLSSGSSANANCFMHFSTLADQGPGDLDETSQQRLVIGPSSQGLSHAGQMDRQTCLHNQ